MQRAERLNVVLLTIKRRQKNGTTVVQWIALHLSLFYNFHKRCRQYMEWQKCHRTTVAHFIERNYSIPEYHSIGRCNPFHLIPMPTGILLVANEQMIKMRYKSTNRNADLLYDHWFQSAMNMWAVCARVHGTMIKKGRSQANKIKIYKGDERLKTFARFGWDCCFSLNFLLPEPFAFIFGPFSLYVHASLVMVVVAMGKDFGSTDNHISCLP